MCAFRETHFFEPTKIDSPAQPSILCGDHNRAETPLSWRTGWGRLYNTPERSPSTGGELHCKLCLGLWDQELGHR